MGQATGCRFSSASAAANLLCWMPKLHPAPSSLAPQHGIAAGKRSFKANLGSSSSLQQLYRRNSLLLLLLVPVAVATIGHGRVIVDLRTNRFVQRCPVQHITA